MSRYDIALICLRGHVVNDASKAYPQHNEDFCSECGSPTFSKCSVCDEAIRGEYKVDNVIGAFQYKRPDFCHACGSPYPWSSSQNTLTIESENDAKNETMAVGSQEVQKKYQVFVSSTQRDLKHERNAVIEAIYRMNHIPVAMEMFNASNEDQWNVITRWTFPILVD
ncbi:MAG: DUF2321 domain-containing protein, partial [Cyanobacteria bacterium HKST-UBA02]|nr:DUF2321 domain-containing protein [Cyanobacteria bacterium HKST-UBA02]